MQARYYDPVIGRFYSNDPVGWSPENPVMSFNRYLYVNNNPYKYTDPDGEWLQLIVKAIQYGHKLYKAHKKTSQLSKNMKAGAQLEKQTVKQLQKTRTDVKEQITVKTKSGTKTRLDIVSKDKGGNIKCTECKSGNSPLTKNQKAAFPEIKESGATVVGKGKAPYTGGTKIPPTKVEIIRKPPN
jgi:uncharacterized protein RhaS with RHS repeats